MYLYVYKSPCIYVAYLALAAAPLALAEGGHFIFWSYIYICISVYIRTYIYLYSCASICLYVSLHIRSLPSFGSRALSSRRKRPFRLLVIYIYAYLYIYVLISIYIAVHLYVYKSRCIYVAYLALEAAPLALDESGHFIFWSYIYMHICTYMYLYLSI